jgi:rSAM/selenodomain-associated transferase 2/rSAM/selenodomain-associated transferase 1
MDSLNGGGQILLFARYPVPGRVKTRLIPALGPARAAALHRRLTEHAAAVARQAGARTGARVTVCSTGAARREFRAWLGADFAYLAQPPGDIGVRMQRGFAAAVRTGARRVVGFGSDLPGLSPELLQRALAALAEHDVVLGPAADGGYYLIGMKRERPELFAGIDWGTTRVCAQTRGAISRLGCSVLELPVLEDVDRPEDLPPLPADPRFADVFTGTPLLSVIVPTLDEEASIGGTLERIRRADAVEVIVADGGSRDATREIAARAGAQVVVTDGGRAAQQNAGAAAASGRLLLFAHADTLLPDGYAHLARRALERPATVAGAFRLRTDGSGAALRVVEWGANVRSRLLQLPYGDQGLFLEKRVFDELGGFAPLPIMEDYELVTRLRRRGRVALLDDAVITSARRWRRLGALSTTLRNLAMVVGFHAGVAPERLARFYRRARTR